ncbi:hypothetical protein LOTGIDRAFT_153440 [Lottia gigantea]|uniref:SMP-30/Gluconolactonase/LRE-like region domain-containing protein n=1 Tax=Lottia gigantea TaxID=225164 RepID=V4AK86_LOTGI|nr:hypothetical protein LOTGIDRAFT_153440 [Lottia gigantea]ESO93961.1 hypothetical protein LOTGIDRAFT_153440 [Lottia gigantea]
MMSAIRRGSICSCLKDPSSAYVAMDHELRAKLEKCFSMTFNDDDDDCGSSGVIVMQINGSDTIVVLDGHNECIKTFCLKNGELLSNRYKLDDRPSSITQTEPEKIAVSFFESKKIAFYSLALGFTLERTIETEKQYYSVAAVTETNFIASAVWDNPVCVDFLEITDAVKVIKSVTSYEDKPLFTCPENIYVTIKKDILISDHGRKAVVCLDDQGNIKFLYHPACQHELETPLGVTSDDEGYIYVVDQSRCLVEKISTEGKYIGPSLTDHDGIENPSTVGFDSKQRMYISQENGDLKIFSLMN